MPDIDDSSDHNEILAATAAANRHREAAAQTPEPSRGVSWPVAAGVAGVAAIGSAALTAALLYAGRKRK